MPETSLMPETLYSWIVVCGYFLTVAVVALLTRRRGSFQVFSVGQRNLHPAFIGLSVAAGATSTATFVVNPGLVYLYGLSGFVAIYFASTAGFFAGLIFFSKSFRRVGDRFAAVTLPQWIGERYGSVAVRVTFAVISLLQVAYLVLVAVAITQVMAKTLDVDVFRTLVFIVVFTAGYILLGGAGTHVLANVVQSVVMMVVAFLLVGSGIKYFGAGFFERMAAVAPHFASVTHPESQLYRDLLEVLVVQFVIGFASTLLPHLIAKSLYLRRESDVNVYLGTAVVAVLIFKSVLITGLVARFELAGGATGELLAPDTVMATYIVEAFSPGIRAVIMLGILAAGFSTLEGILLTLSSIFAGDLVGPLIRRGGGEGLSSGQSLKVARLFIVVLVPILIYLSYDQIVNPQLSVIIFAFNGILAATAATFMPVLYGIYGRGRPAGRVLLSAAVALTVHYAMVFLEIGRYHDNPMVPATLALTAACMVFWLAGLGSRNTGETSALPAEGKA